MCCHSDVDFRDRETPSIFTAEPTVLDVTVIISRIVGIYSHISNDNNILKSISLEP
jgi:hypothetical protein